MLIFVFRKRKSFFFLIVFIYFWLCWVFVAVGELSVVVVNGGDSLVVVCGFLIALTSLVAGHRLQNVCSAVAAQGLSCYMACQVFLNQGPNLHLLHWQVDSLPLIHQGSPRENL